MNKIAAILLLIAVLIYISTDEISSYFYDGIEKTTDAKKEQDDAVVSVTGKSTDDKLLGDTGNTDTHDRTASGQTQQLEPVIRDSLRELVDTSHEGLVEEKTQNGIRMDLKGKFRTAPVATIDEQGELTVRDYTTAPTR